MVEVYVGENGEIIFQSTPMPSHKAIRLGKKIATLDESAEDMDSILDFLESSGLTEIS